MSLSPTELADLTAREAELDAILAKLIPSLDSLGFFPPHSGQVRVLEERARYNVLKCGRRIGKTELLKRLTAETAREGKPAAYMAPSYDMLDRVYGELCELLRRWPGVVISKSKHRIDLPTGGFIECWSLGDEANRVRGNKYARVCLDECAMVDSLQVAWEESVSPTLMDLGGDAWFASTPKLGSVFDDFYLKGQAGVPGWASWQLPTHMNPFITASEIEERRSNMTEAAFRREILAESEAEGSDLVHPGFSVATHVKVSPVKWADCRWRVMGFDPGGGDPTAMVAIGVDRRGYFHQFGEFWRERGAGSVSLPVVVGEVGKWNKLGKLDAVVVDRTAKGWVESLRAHGFPAYESVSARGEGLEVIDWLLEGPRLTIEPACEKSIEEFRGYRFDVRRDSVSGKMFKTKNAHWTHSDLMDARRYACLWIVRNLRGQEKDMKLKYAKPVGYRPMGVLG